MRILVCGDRNWTDKRMIGEVLIGEAIDATFPLFGRENVVIIHGASRGADSIAGEWVARWSSHNVTEEVYPANWEKYGRAAGPIRNQQMLDEGKPDLVLAFHDDFENSKGTKDMVTRARKAGIKVKVLSHKTTNESGPGQMDDASAEEDERQRHER
jgi:hypothetical protein